MMQHKEQKNLAGATEKANKANKKVFVWTLMKLRTFPKSKTKKEFQEIFLLVESGRTY